MNLRYEHIYLGRKISSQHSQFIYVLGMHEVVYKSWKALKKHHGRKEDDNRLRPREVFREIDRGDGSWWINVMNNL